MPTPALDFCRKVDMWQRDEGRKTAGLIVVLPDGEDDSLEAILAEAGRSMNLNFSEARARRWLVGYQAMEAEQRVLTGDQRRELDSIVACIPLWEHRERGEQHRRPSRTVQRVIIAAVVGALALTAGIFTRSALSGNGEQGSPPAAGAPVNPAPGPAQGGATDLQQFRADWNIPVSASASAGDSQVQLVLLQDGLYYPAPWGLLAGADNGWQPDTTGSVTAQDHGPGTGLRDVTDSGGTTYTVSVGQPFVLSSNPQVVYRVLRDATVQTIPQPHAIRVRVPVTTR